MVKNTKGGSGHKGQARKYTTNASGASKTRFAEDEGEIYAQVTAVLGNGMCHVICADNKKRLCMIRGKFRGRGKNDNILNMNKWVLIGIREFESEKTGIGKDLDRCDLLEVYSDLDKDRLKSRETTINWNLFIANDFANAKEFWSNRLSQQFHDLYFRFFGRFIEILFFHLFKAIMDNGRS